MKIAFKGATSASKKKIACGGLFWPPPAAASGARLRRQIARIFLPVDLRELPAVVNPKEHHCRGYYSARGFSGSKKDNGLPHKGRKLIGARYSNDSQGYYVINTGLIGIVLESHGQIWLDLASVQSELCVILCASFRYHRSPRSF